MTELDRVKELAALLVEQQGNVKKLKEELKQAEKLSRCTEREDLPMLMKELEIEKFTLSTGETISVIQDCDAAITQATTSDALRWLVENNFGGIIKTALTVEYGIGEREEAEEVYTQLIKDDVAVTLTDKVHPATLKSFVKEQLKKGAPVPMDLFNVRAYTKVKVTKN